MVTLTSMETTVAKVATLQHIEKASFLGWPALSEQTDGTYTARFANGISKRVNSISFADAQDTDDFEARIAKLCAAYTAQNFAPILRITPLTPPHIAKYYMHQNWTELDISDVLISTQLHDAIVANTAEFYHPTDGEFLQIQATLKEQPSLERETFAAQMQNLSTPAQGIVHRDGNAPVASLLVACVGQIGMISAVVTAPQHRRQGHAAALMQTAHAWLASQNATCACLQVYSGNLGAKSLYSKLGYQHSYTYSYLIPKAFL